MLGPWHVGRNPAEAALHAFSGGPGAPLPPPWTAVGVHIAGAVAPSQSTFVQSDSLACQLMAAQLDLLAHLVAEVSVSNQQVLVNMLANAATWGGQPKRAPKEWRRRVAVVGTAAAVALDGCERWRKRTKGGVCEKCRVVYLWVYGWYVYAIVNVCMDVYMCICMGVYICVLKRRNNTSIVHCTRAAFASGTPKRQFAYVPAGLPCHTEYRINQRRTGTAACPAGVCCPRGGH